MWNSFCTWCEIRARFLPFLLWTTCSSTIYSKSLYPTYLPCHICNKARVSICMGLFLDSWFCSTFLFIYLSLHQYNAALFIILDKEIPSTSFFRSVLAISLLFLHIHFRNSLLGPTKTNQTKTVVTLTGIALNL